MPQQFNDLVISFIRTLTAVIAGAVITWLVAKGVDVEATLKAPLTEVLFALFSGGYYLLVRVIEQYVSRHAGWLLGLPLKPGYQKV